jgi:amidase
MSIEACLERIEELNPRLNAITRTLEPKITDGPLAGLAFSVKENIDVKGTPTTFGLLGDFPDAPHDAPHVAHLRAAGAVPIARGNLPDLALRWHTESARYGATINPLDETLSPGGSSGGDAVAVATGMVDFAVGSDYGGSLRVPASVTGVYALRPTPGRLAQAFAAPPFVTRQLMASDGPLATRFEDLALLLEVMSRPSDRDPRYVPGAAGRGGPARVALVLADAAGRRAAAALSDAGHDVFDAGPAGIEEAAQLWLDAVGYEAKLGPLDQVVSEGTRRSATALFSLSRVTGGAGYAQALARRHKLAQEWTHPLVLGPVSTAEPWPAGHDQGGPDALREEWWGFRLTVATACLGLPALSFPDGVQLVARWWDEARLMEVGRAAVDAGELDEQADAPT